jgi:hypothetical protein
MTPFDLQEIVNKLYAKDVIGRERTKYENRLIKALELPERVLAQIFVDYEDTKKAKNWINEQIGVSEKFEKYLEWLQDQLKYLKIISECIKKYQYDDEFPPLLKPITHETAFAATDIDEFQEHQKIKAFFKNYIVPQWKEEKLDVDYGEHIIDGIFEYKRLAKDRIYNTFGVVALDRKRGQVLEFHLDVQPGSFDVDFTNLDVKEDTKYSLHKALNAALSLIGAHQTPHTVNAECLISAPKVEIEGESFGLTLAIGVIAKLLKLPLRDKKIVLTGRLYEKDNIGDVGFLDAKLNAAESVGMSQFIFPANSHQPQQKERLSRESRYASLPLYQFNRLQDAVYHIWGKEAFENAKNNATFEQLYSDPNKFSHDPIPFAKEFIGRKSDLECYEKMLEEHKVAIISGGAGVGKTAIGAELTKNWNGDKNEVFWFEFSEAKKDAEVFLKSGAAFLAKNAYPDLWHQMESEKGEGAKRMPLNQKINMFCYAIERGNYLLCLDDVHVAIDDENIQHLLTQIRERLNNSRMILMTREHLKPFNDLYYEDLEGLSREDAESFLSNLGVDVE